MCSHVVTDCLHRHAGRQNRRLRALDYYTHTITTILFSKMSAEPANQTLSKYVEHLDGECKQRYIGKCAIVGVQDPYNLPANLFTPIHECRPSDIPDFAYHDLYNYLVNRQSYFTGKALKAYKSLEAYSYFVSGWVNGVKLWKVPNKPYFLVVSKVSVV